MQPTPFQNFLDASPADYLQRSLALISGKWRLVIIQELANNTMRFGDLRQLLPAISEKVLASELKILTEQGALTRKAYYEMPRRVEYSLTDLGRSVLPIIKQLKQIGMGLTQE